MRRSLFSVVASSTKKSSSSLSKGLNRFQQASQCRFSTSSTGAQEDVKFKKTPMRLLLGFLGMNVVFGWMYLKKVERDNRFTMPILLKLLDFEKQYNSDATQLSVEHIEKLFDEFLVENVVLSLDTKKTEQIRKIAKELALKYPASKQIQFFTSEASEYERRAGYLKAAMIADRGYIDDVLIRQMTLNCSRYGKENPFFLEEFFSTCTKFSLQPATQHQADECLKSYLSLNPKNYFRAANQRIKNLRDNQKYAEMLLQIEDLFIKEQEIIEPSEKKKVLEILQGLSAEKDLTERADRLKAATLLAEVDTEAALKFIKPILKSNSKDAEARAISDKLSQKKQESS